MKLKSQQWTWRSKCTLILAKKVPKNEIYKLHEEWKISHSQVYRQPSKNGGAIHPFSQNARPIPKLPHNSKKNKQKIRRLSVWQLDRATTIGQPAVTHQPWPDALTSPYAKKNFFFFPSFFCTCGQLLLVGSSTCPPYPDFS
jgi:hypothetical protein